MEAKTRDGKAILYVKYIKDVVALSTKIEQVTLWLTAKRYNKLSYGSFTPLKI